MSMEIEDKALSPWALGAPLYVPTNRRDLLAIANGEKLAGLRAMIFCTEDAVAVGELNESLQHLRLSLQGYRPMPDKLRFIRARNPEVLQRLLDMPHIERIDGFVLPKLTLGNLAAYLGPLRHSGFAVMPTLETREAFDAGAMRELRDALLQQGDAIRLALLRIGGNDLLNLLGIRRPRGLTLYDTPLGPVIAQLVATFKPYGFALSAPVYEYLDDKDTLLREVRLDLAHGLTGKTAIHPAQITWIEDCYRVGQDELDMAASLLDTAMPAVFKMHGAMCEVTTHRRWATETMERYRLYGTTEKQFTESLLFANS